MVRIKPEIIQGPKANRVRVLILRKSFRVPSDRACVLSNIPRRAAVSGIPLGAIMCKSRVLRWRVKSDIRDIHSESNRHAERLDTAIEVFVVERIFIVPNAGSRVCHFESHEPDAVVSGVRLNLIHCRTSPRHDGRLLLHGGAYGTKREGLVDSGYAVLTVRSVVIHVALARMTLAPCVFVRDDVLRLSKIRRSRV